MTNLAWYIILALGIPLILATDFAVYLYRTLHYEREADREEYWCVGEVTKGGANRAIIYSEEGGISQAPVGTRVYIKMEKK